ncbi:restriction endonuclease subunit S [Xanthobacter sp. ZOL 2024]
MSVRMVPIGDVIDRVSTWNPANAADDEFDYIDLSAVDQDCKLISGCKRILTVEAPSRARQLVRKGDVLVSTVRPNLNGVAKVLDEHDGMTASTGFCVLRPKERRLDESYLFHWVRSPSFVRGMVQQATGASYPAVSDRIIKASEIPLPPLDEQKRIAAILDKADALRRKRRQALALLDSLTQSIFLEMFGRANSAYPTVRLADITHRITDGVHQKPTYTEVGVPFISVKDITTGILSFDKCKFISLEDHKKYTKRCKPERGDILYTKVGVTYGRPAIINTDDEFSIYVSVSLIKPDRTRIRPKFLNALMATDLVKSQADRCIKGIGVPDLHLDQIQRFQIPLPPLLEQVEFEKVVDNLELISNPSASSLDVLDSAFASLQHRAFTGQI